MAAAGNPASISFLSSEGQALSISLQPFSFLYAVLTAQAHLYSSFFDGSVHTSMVPRGALLSGPLRQSVSSGPRPCCDGGHTAFHTLSSRKCSLESSGPCLRYEAKAGISGLYGAQTITQFCRCHPVSFETPSSCTAAQGFSDVQCS